MMEFVLSICMSVWTSVVGITGLPVTQSTCQSSSSVTNGVCESTKLDVKQSVCKTDPKTGKPTCDTKQVTTPAPTRTSRPPVYNMPTMPPMPTMPTMPTMSNVTFKDGKICVSLKSDGMNLDYCAPATAMTQDQFIAGAIRAVTVDVNQGFLTGCGAVSITKSEQSLGVTVGC